MGYFQSHGKSSSKISNRHLPLLVEYWSFSVSAIHIPFLAVFSVSFLQEIFSSFMPFAQEAQNIPGSILAQVPPRFACIARYSLYFLSLLEHPLWLSDGDSGGPYFWELYFVQYKQYPFSNYHSPAPIARHC